MRAKRKVILSGLSVLSFSLALAQVKSLRRWILSLSPNSLLALFSFRKKEKNFRKELGAPEETNGKGKRPVGKASIRNVGGETSRRRRRGL